MSSAVEYVNYSTPSKRVKILGIWVDVLERREVLDNVSGYLNSRQPHFIITANSLMVNRVTVDRELIRAFWSASMVIPDSTGIVWAAKFLKGIQMRRIPGIDLMVQICRHAAKSGHTVYLFGSREWVNQKAAKNLSRIFSGLQIIGRHHGYFNAENEESIIQDIQKKKPDILFVGLDVPRQEKWIMKNYTALKVPVIMGIGGSLDILSGRLKRAPIWMRLMGLEWFYRFTQQPWRIWRIINLPVFVFKVVRQKYALRNHC